MNVLQKMLSRFTAKASGTSSAFGTMDVSRIAAEGGTAAGKYVSPQTVMGLSAAWGCMRIISEAIGCIPRAMFRREANGNTTRADDHPLAEVLVRSPNADMTGVEFFEASALHLCQAGNTFAYIDRHASTGSVIALTPIPNPDRDVQAVRDSDGTVYYKVLVRGQWVRYPRERILHVKGFGGGGLTGLSPLGAARESAGFAMAAAEFGSKFFAQGGKPSGVVTIPGFLSKDQRVIARENLSQMLSGMANAHKFALFEGGMKPEPWGAMPLKDLEFALLMRFGVQEMCRFYRVPPHMLADLEKGASYASIEQMSAEFVMFTLMPYFTRFEASVAKWLLTPAERAQYFFRFNYEGLLRADSKGRSEFYASAVQNGWMTRNEVRSKENLNTSTDEGMDDFTAQVNLAPVDKLGAAPPAQQKPFNIPDANPGKAAPTLN